MAAQCFFCKGASESPALDRGFSCCRKCGREKLLPYLRQVLGAEALAGALNETAAGAGKFGSAAMMSLVDAAQKARQRAKREHRKMYPSELSLSLAATAAVQEAKTVAANSGRSAGQVTKEGIAAAVQRAGLRTSSSATTTLSTAAGSTPRPAPRRPQPAGQVTKESIAEAVRRAGLRTA